MNGKFSIRSATPEDVPVILGLVHELAAYEKLSHEVTATEELLRRNLFGERRHAEAILVWVEEECAGFALFFHNFSTFLGKPGLYLEDLYVRPEFRGRGYGRAMMIYLARLASERDCGRFEWAVLNWNEPSLEFYRSIGALPMSDWTIQRVVGKALEKLSRQKMPGE
ncbi:MAG TPA: GNAT family N-acetyltransferase [Verrucomicrobiae bacterium]|nr:GNAT family N-acetyltransferase [Verrucomicrobiae bacterium]